MREDGPTLLFVFPGPLCFQEGVEHIPARLDTAENIVTGPHTFEELCIRIVARPVVRHIGKVHPNRFNGIFRLKQQRGKIDADAFAATLFVSMGSSSVFFACLAGVAGLLGLGRPKGFPQSAIGSSFDFSDFNTSE